MGSHWDRPHDVFHMVVDLCQVLNPCSTMYQKSEVVLLTNQEGVGGQVEAVEHILQNPLYKCNGVKK